jgi:hypothetical protein
VILARLVARHLEGTTVVIPEILACYFRLRGPPRAPARRIPRVMVNRILRRSTMPALPTLPPSHVRGERPGQLRDLACCN